MSPHKIDMVPLPASLASYGISDNGFLPAEEPLSQLSSPIYQPWEKIIKSLPELVRTSILRREVDRLAVLSTEHLLYEPEWQRAYSVLAMIAQAYIWGGEAPLERLPPSVAIPLLKVSEHLEVSPIASYASLNLWNWRLLGANGDARLPDKIQALQTVTGTDDESWFYVVSNAIEARTGSTIKIMLHAIEAASAQDLATVTSALQLLSDTLVDIANLVERMDERCDPQIFYHDIRPFLAGSKNMESAGLPRGVFYDEGDGKGSWRKYRGGSNGQSSLIQFLDIILGIDQAVHSSFHQEMREYMPGPHARFLADVEACANIRQFVLDNSDSMNLASAYNDAIQGLTAFRDKHIKLVARYILLPSRQYTRSPSTQRNLAAVSTKIAAHTDSNLEFVGTGGTKLVPFLKRTRDETSSVSIKDFRSLLHK